MKGNETKLHPDYLPRLTLDLRADQIDSLREHIPHGMKKRIFGFIIDDLIEILKGPHKQLFLGGMAARDYDLSVWVKVPKISFKKLVQNLIS